jgi:protein-tyrosine phosphatase
MNYPIRICFVCLGNIVRSPLAKNLFIHLAQQLGVSCKYEVDSAGTGDWHLGEPPDARMRQVAAQHGLHYDNSARQFRRSNFDLFDLILAMDHENLADLRGLARSDADRQKIHLLREYDPQGGPQAVVPDPYYDRVEGFEEVFRVIERSCQGLLNALEKNEIDLSQPPMV